jgi:hypothetical protein
MSETERRGSRRCSVELPVVVRAGAESGWGLLRSVSRLGALIESEKRHAVGTALELRIRLFDDVLDVRGQVVRTETYAGVNTLGVMFAPLTLTALTKIDSLVASS